MQSMSRAVLVLAAAMFVVPALHAQAALKVAAGATVPVGDFADNVNTGYNVTVGVEIKPPLAPIGLRLDGMLNGLEGKTDAWGTSRVLAGTANLTLSGAGMPIPMGYLIAGLGVYNHARTELPTGVTKPESTNDLGINVGAGINIPLTGFGTFLEARLHFVMGDNKRTFVPITFGVSF